MSAKPFPKIGSLHLSSKQAGNWRKGASHASKQTRQTLMFLQMRRDSYLIAQQAIERAKLETRPHKRHVNRPINNGWPVNNAVVYLNADRK